MSSGMKLPPFDPGDLRPLRAFCAEGKLPMPLRHAQNECASGKFPAVMIAHRWHTTEAWIRSYLWKRATPAAKQITT
jgi:hypothetical protein